MQRGHGTCTNDQQLPFTHQTRALLPGERLRTPTVVPTKQLTSRHMQKAIRMHDSNTQVRWPCYDPCAFASGLLPPPASLPPGPSAASRPSPSSLGAAAAALRSAKESSCSP